MAGRYSNPVPQYLDDDGIVLNGGKLYFYQTGSSTILQNTYSDASLTTPNANPVILDSSGRLPSVFASYESVYNVVLKDSSDVEIWSRDPVRFVDVQEIADLIAQLEEDIANLQSTNTGAENPVRNSSCDSVSLQSSPNLTGSFLQGPVIGALGRVTGTVSAGTLTNGSLSGLGVASTQIKFSGVTGDSSSVVEAVWRIGAYDARRFANKTCSVSVAARQESGVTADCNVLVGKATAVNDFSTVTNISDVAQTLATGTNGTLSATGVAMGDCSNGIEIKIKIKPNATFTTKDFYVTDVQLIEGATAPAYIAAKYPEDVTDSRVNESGIFLDSGTANALVVSTSDYIFSIYDGFKITVRKGSSDSSSTTPTLNVNSLGATTIKRNDGGACVSGDMKAGGTYDFVYSSSASAWLLQNPYTVTIGQFPSQTYMFSTGVCPGSTTTSYPFTLSVAGAYNVSLATKVAQGRYKIDFTTTANTGVIPVFQPEDSTASVNIPTIISRSTTSVTVEFKGLAGATQNPEQIHFHVVAY